MSPQVLGDLQPERFDDRRPESKSAARDRRNFSGFELSVDQRLLVCRFGKRGARRLQRTRRGGSCKGLAMPTDGAGCTEDEYSPCIPESLERSRKANWKHGRYSAEVIADRREATAACRLLSAVGPTACRSSRPRTTRSMPSCRPSAAIRVS